VRNIPCFSGRGTSCWSFVLCLGGHNCLISNLRQWRRVQCDHELGNSTPPYSRSQRCHNTLDWCNLLISQLIPNKTPRKLEV
jgi:hypothetical protein